MVAPVREAGKLMGRVFRHAPRGQATRRRRNKASTHGSPPAIGWRRSLLDDDLCFAAASGKTAPLMTLRALTGRTKRAALLPRASWAARNAPASTSRELAQSRSGSQGECDDQGQKYDSTLHPGSLTLTQFMIGGPLDGSQALSARPRPRTTGASQATKAAIKITMAPMKLTVAGAPTKCALMPASKAPAGIKPRSSA